MSPSTDDYSNWRNSLMTSGARGVWRKPSKCAALDLGEHAQATTESERPVTNAVGILATYRAIVARTLLVPTDVDAQKRLLKLRQRAAPLLGRRSLTSLNDSPEGTRSADLNSSEVQTRFS